MKKLLVIMIVLLLSACGDKPVMQNSHALDQCMRTVLFQQCMKLLPAGPMATKYNDWDEVVSECNSTARSQSIRKREYIKQECIIDY